MPMGVMHVRHMRVAVVHRLMAMPVCVRFSWRVAWAMSVPMVLIMSMGVCMLNRMMPMFMVVIFGEVQPDAERHQNPGGNQLNRDGIMQDHDCGRGPQERSGREISARSRGPQMPQSENEKNKAQAIAEKTNDPCDEERSEPVGRLAPAHKPSARLNGPAIKPFSSTIWSGSASDTLRVRLLSSPQATQAPTMASGPMNPDEVGVPVHDSTIALPRGKPCRERPGDRSSHEKQTTQEQPSPRLRESEAAKLLLHPFEKDPP